VFGLLSRHMKDFMLAILTIAVIVLSLENSDLRRAVESIENGYIELMERKLPGTDSHVGDHIKPGSMGIFAMKNKTVVCGELDGAIERQAQGPERP
jgi:hypothetical protein